MAPLALVRVDGRELDLGHGATRGVEARAEQQQLAHVRGEDRDAAGRVAHLLRVRVRVRARAWARARVRVRVRVGLGLG